MASLGELFIALGFDVDDTKLKNFRSALTDTNEGMKKLGKNTAEALGIITGSISTLALFTQHAADGGVKLNNMALQFGANAQAAQTFANALHQVNSLISVSAGQESFGKFSQLILGQIPLGEGNAAALQLLGGDFKPGSGQSPMEILANLAAHYNDSKARLGAAYGVQLGKISGMEQAEPAIRLLANNPAAFYAAGQYNMQDDQIARFAEFSKSTAEFGEAISRFENTVTSLMAPALTNFFNAITELLNKLPSTEKTGDRLLDEKQRMQKDGFWKWFLVDPFVDVYHSFGKKTDADVPAGKSSTLPPGVMWRLFEESGMRPNAVGDGGLAYGIAQWHPDRQAAFKRVMGFDIHGSSVDQQQQFVAWELAHGDPKAQQAGRLIEGAQSQADIYRAFTKLYERPAGSQNININVHSNADARTVAHEVKRELQGAMNRTHALMPDSGF